MGFARSCNALHRGSIYSSREHAARASPLSVSYIADRPDYEWPEHRRLAFYIAPNLEHFAFKALFSAGILSACGRFAPRSCIA